MELPSEEKLKDISVAMAVLKAGAEISYNRPENRSWIQNMSPICENYQEREYPVDDFLLLEKLGLLRLDTANWEFEDWHFFWNHECYAEESQNFKPTLFPGHFGDIP